MVENVAGGRHTAVTCKDSQHVVAEKLFGSTDLVRRVATRLILEHHPVCQGLAIWIGSALEDLTSLVVQAQAASLSAQSHTQDLRKLRRTTDLRSHSGLLVGEDELSLCLQLTRVTDGEEKSHLADAIVTTRRAIPGSTRRRLVRSRAGFHSFELLGELLSWTRMTDQLPLPIFRRTPAQKDIGDAFFEIGKRIGFRDVSGHAAFAVLGAVLTGRNHVPACHVSTQHGTQANQGRQERIDFSAHPHSPAR